MVKVNEGIPYTTGGQVDPDAWLEQVCDQRELPYPDQIRDVCGWIRDNHSSAMEESIELAELVAGLNMDQPSVMASLLYRSVRNGVMSPEIIVGLAGSETRDIVTAVNSMASTSLLELSNSALLEKSQEDQVENIKRMLAALIDDVRVAVVKLAERVVALRHAKSYSEDRRSRIAVEAQAVFAPLAGRLGIWQLKWELEDLSLRYTDQATYMQIAKQLKSRRADREVQIQHLVDQVRGLLRGYGIEAEVFGRAKHIYSIWRKMQTKGVSLDQVYDVSAVRVVVDSLAECYAALGVIHNTWPHVPQEFDDYIANPKENGYQSIHTAVLGPEERVLEIQIRTRAMHEDAELGVCAHWSYKGGDPQAEGGEPSGADFSSKMEWLRQVMEWHEELAGTESLNSLLRHRVSQARIYVSTPKGHVLELPAGATALDFAYRVHTDVGHACTGARIDGQPAALQTPLNTGQQVEIVSGGAIQPRREWIEPELKFVHSDRAKAKLVNYFRTLDPAEQQQTGEALFMSRLAACGVRDPSETLISDASEAFGISGRGELLRAIGAAELYMCDVLQHVLQKAEELGQLELPELNAGAFPRDMRVRVTGENRDGFLHDITEQLKSLDMALSGTTGRVSNIAEQAIITLDVEVTGWIPYIRLVDYLLHIPGVTSVERD